MEGLEFSIARMATLLGQALSALGQPYKRHKADAVDHSLAEKSAICQLVIFEASKLQRYKGGILGLIPRPARSSDANRSKGSRKPRSTCAMAGTDFFNW
jgi:hypothetical protein